MDYQQNASFMKMIEDNEKSIWHNPELVKALLENRDAPVNISRAYTHAPSPGK